MRFAISGLVLAFLAAPAAALLARSRADAERQVGAFLLLLGFGLALRLAAVHEASVVVALNVAGHVLLSLAGIPLLRFTRSVFRPDEAWARWLERAGIGVTFAALPAMGLDGGFGDEGARSLVLVNGSRMLACAWSFSEALRYRGLMRRRAALGLAEPALVNRFTLWSIWMGALTATFAFVLALRIIGGGTHVESMVVVVRPALAGGLAIAAVALQLTFFPPRAYLRWVARAS
ncbi:MAG TPA: hypothetical protein VFT98_18630 [Myxococcota bacterium]|nr:hypothetical protein [Myxococcota bacterium]